MLAGNAAFSPGAYDLLETQVLTSSASSVTFTGLGSYSDYKHLQVRMVQITSSIVGTYMQLNGDTGTNYSTHYLIGTGSSAISGAGTSTSNPYAGYADDLGGAGIVDVLDFSNTNKYTTWKSLAGENDAITPRIALFSGAWLNTSAVTSMTFYHTASNFQIGSRFSLYGIKGA